MIQSSEELRSSRVAKTFVVQWPRVAWAGVDLGDELAQVLHVAVADLATALHDHGGEDDGVHLAVRDPKRILLGAEVLEELVTEAGVQLVAKGRRLQLLLGVVFLVIFVDETHDRFDFTTDVIVLVALEKACDGMISLNISCRCSVGHLKQLLRRLEGLFDG